MEKVYENGLAHQLRKAGLDVRQQYPIQVYDEDGTLIGDYYADLLVEGWLMVELKTAKALADEHSAQVLGYLKSAPLVAGGCPPHEQALVLFSALSAFSAFSAFFAV